MNDSTITIPTETILIPVEVIRHVHVLRWDTDSTAGGRWVCIECGQVEQPPFLAF